MAVSDPDTDSAEPAPFEIALTMAGAISGGAYSAGVADFLGQALAEWTAAKAAASPAAPSVPTHPVVIKTIAGASAGAVTGALAAVAMAEDPVLPPQAVTVVSGADSPISVGVAFPRLFRTWVVRPRLVAAGPGEMDLLSDEDLANNQPVRSALNALLLDGIAREALSDVVATPRPYFATSLHLYFTISNLKGVPYGIAFTAGPPGQAGQVMSHVMQSHGDRAHYRMTGLGTAAAPSAWADGDSARPLDAGTLASSTAVVSAPWSDYVDAALASGAFPLGLAARVLWRQRREWDGRRWPLDTPGFRIEPLWPVAVASDPAFPIGFANVDGGAINNEPFEYARWSLMKTPGAPNARSALEVDRAVVMIDPFPEPPRFDAAEVADTTLLSVLEPFLSIGRAQSRFKPNEIAAVLDETVFSRFMVAPRRSAAPGSSLPAGIAAAALDGFGGFLSEAFRAHDYQLGRRNCQRFLQDVFALPAGNRFLAPYIAAHPAVYGRFVTPTPGPDPADPARQVAYFPIIPLVGSAAVEVPEPPWPRIPGAELEELFDRIEDRLDAVVRRLVEQQVESAMMRLFINIIWRFWGRAEAMDAIRERIEGDLRARGQMA